MRKWRERLIRANESDWPSQPPPGLDREALRLRFTILVNRKIRVALLAARACAFLPGCCAGKIILGVADTDFTRGIEWRNLAQAVFGIEPVIPIDFAAPLISLLPSRDEWLSSCVHIS